VFLVALFFCHERHQIARKFMINSLSQPKSDVLMKVLPQDPFVLIPLRPSAHGEIIDADPLTGRLEIASLLTRKKRKMTVSEIRRSSTVM
jgi:hypothetical protein